MTARLDLSSYIYPTTHYVVSIYIVKCSSSQFHFLSVYIIFLPFICFSWGGIFFSSVLSQNFRESAALLQNSPRQHMLRCSMFKKIKTVFLFLFKQEHKVLLTGTPLQNSVEELFSLLNFLEPLQFPSESTFLEEFGDLKTDEQVGFDLYFKCQHPNNNKIKWLYSICPDVIEIYFWVLKEAKRYCGRLTVLMNRPLLARKLGSFHFAEGSLAVPALLLQLLQLTYLICCVRHTSSFPLISDFFIYFCFRSQLVLERSTALQSH